MLFNRRGLMILLLVIYIFIGYHRVALGEKFGIQSDVILGGVIVLSAIVIYFGWKIPQEVYVMYVQKPVA